MSGTVDLLVALQRWYAAHCNGDWEHSFGVRIDTLDNPGWSLEVDLNGTELVARSFDGIDVERRDNDWLRCSVEDGAFKCFGGPENLTEMLQRFLEWAKA